MFPYTERKVCTKLLDKAFGGIGSDSDYDNEFIQTLVVTGPHGSGKSTLVRKYLEGKGMNGMVRLHLHKSDFADTVLEALNLSFTPSGTRATTLLYSALMQLWKESKMPIFLVEVDDRCKGEHLLLLLKAWGEMMKSSQRLLWCCHRHGQP